jgi:periplasmic protein TonB
MNYDAISYQKSRIGWSLLGGIILLHGGVIAALLTADVEQPQIPMATPLTVRWVSQEPMPDIEPEPDRIPAPVIEPEPVVEMPAPPVVKQPTPIKVKPKSVELPKPIKKPKPKPIVKPKSKPVELKPKKVPVQQIKAPVKRDLTTKVDSAVVDAPKVEAPQFNAAYLSNPAPDYPRRSRMLEEEGMVKLKVHVSVSGKVLTINLFKSSGFKRLDDAAFKAVRKWRFVPAKQGNQSINGWVIVPISFKLRS